ncbi:MAG: FusB/FusC family EF-G-binding protein [Niameybacter sp.]|uniref:FusB/FusC family EF-G-binding protein n=1 Tax=Niameybacter sp. TaxID=2033640 RepID=UPI002FC9410E
MDTFIKKEHYNFIKKCLSDLNTTFKCCTDKNIVETCKLSTRDQIFNLFEALTEEQITLIDINTLQTALDIDSYTKKLDGYVYGMAPITNAQISKLFKKEHKIKMPDSDAQDTPHVYLSWIDESIRKLFIVYPINDKLVGMACRLPNSNSKNKHICTLCHYVGDETEVACVSPVCKATSSDAGAYRSISFDVCLDSKKCNDRITSAEKLENLLKDVCQIK